MQKTKYKKTSGNVFSGHLRFWSVFFRASEFFIFPHWFMGGCPTIPFRIFVVHIQLTPYETSKMELFVTKNNSWKLTVVTDSLVFKCGIYMLKVSKKTTRITCQIYSKPDASIVNLNIFCTLFYILCFMLTSMSSK